MLLKIPLGTRKNLSVIKYLEVRHGSPEVSASPDVGSVEVKGFQMICLAGCIQMSPADTVAWNVKGKPYYDTSSVRALCITSNNVKMEQTVKTAYIIVVCCGLVFFTIYVARQ